MEGFVIAFTSLASLADPRAFRAWLVAIVTRRAIAAIRRRRLLSRLGFVRVEPLQMENVIARDAPPDVVAELTAIYRRMDEHEHPGEPRSGTSFRRMAPRDARMAAGEAFKTPNAGEASASRRGS